eukprot:TRINITY_DN6797_c0_g1_i1.p1 TRINITY_DN6797_c0_g1~~TRINITY_DN6797_c0_g1_i1.p1  ORF type:complete len:317 (-),score=87.13 TRINITY_DN6797_c0_g1_i1:66-1016(-)
MMSAYSYPSSSPSPSPSSSSSSTSSSSNNLRQHYNMINPYQLSPVGSCGNFHVLSPSSSNGRLPSWMHNNSRPRSKPHSRGRDKWTAASRSKGGLQITHNQKQQQTENIMAPSSQVLSFIPSSVSSTVSSSSSSSSSSSHLSNSIFLPSTFPPRASSQTPIFKNNNIPYQPNNYHNPVRHAIPTTITSGTTSPFSSPAHKKARLSSDVSTTYSYPSSSPSSPVSLSPSSSPISSPASPSSSSEPSSPRSPSSPLSSPPPPSSYLSIQHIISPSSSPRSSPVSDEEDDYVSLPPTSTLKRPSPLDLLCLCALSNTSS